MLRGLILLLGALPLIAGPIRQDQQVEMQPVPSDAGTSIVFEFPTPAIEVIDGLEILRLQDEGNQGKAGKPDLPLVNRLVEIPATKGVTLEIQFAEWESMGQHDVRPLQERLHTDYELPLPWVQDLQLYSSDHFWPEEWAGLSDPVLVRNTRLVKLSLSPFRWNPVSGELEALRRVELSLSFSGTNPINVPPPTLDDEDGLSDDDEGLIYAQQRRHSEAGFVNTLLGSSAIRLNTLESASDENGALESITWDAPGLPLNYLVLAKTAAQNQTAFQNWIEWKRKKGHHVEIRSESDVSFTSSSAIRGLISSEYNNSEYPPHYVVLVGDTEGSYTIATHNSQYDHYYSTISGNDILADVVVGRVSVETANELATVLNKIVNYETAPDVDPGTWLERASFLTGTGHCGESMSQLSRSIGFQLMQERGYTQIDTAFCASSPSYVYNWMNQGISFYNYRGWIGMEGLSQNQLMNMTNPYTPIAVVFTCSSGDFDESWEVAYSEAFLRGGNASQMGGAAAAMGFCTPYTHTAHNNVVCGGFWSGMLDYGIPQVGTCMFRGKYDIYQTLPIGDSNVENFSYWANLMGDPGMDMWCGIPVDMQLEGLPTTIGAGEQTLSLRVVEGLGGLSNVTVCAWFDENRSVRALTNEQGYVELQLPRLETGTLHVTATRGFHYPILADCEVDVEHAMPVLDEISLVDENEDGAWVLGETASLDITISNGSASLPLEAMTVQLSCQDEGIQILDADGVLAGLDAGGSATITGGLQIEALQTRTSGLPVRLELSLLTGHEEFFQHFNVELMAPALGIVSGGLTDALYPGETETVQVRIANNGNAQAQSPELVFSFASEEGFEANPASIMLDSIDPDQQQVVEVEVTAQNNLVPGYTTQLIANWTTGTGAMGEVRQQIVLGEELSTDPSGPDAWGYFAFESSDSQWMPAPVYNWIEIAPNAGGGGDEINLHDNGDEQDDSRRVNLPFNFTYYGQVYNSLAVCSNGFVAFGELAHLETDFRNHFLPSGMGPEPMIAPMWDDHKLTSDAQVCTEYLEDSGIFVIEWYRMRTNSNNRINTFQLLLFDPALYVTPTGDGEFVFQYHTFDDSQSNSQDFPYCTVGIKNHDATVGLNLLNYHVEAGTIQDIEAGMAIRFTTSIGLNTEPAVLDMPVGEMNLFMMHSEMEEQSDSLAINNLGEAPLIWSASVVPPINWPGPTGRDTGGPDAQGYTWIDSDEAAGPEVGWVDPGAESVPVDFLDNDDNQGPFDIGFDFPFYGGVYDEFWVSSNGFLSFEDPVDGYYQNNIGGLPDNDAPDLALFPWWDDLLTDESLTGIVSYYSSEDSLVVSWVDAPHFNESAYGGPFTFQVVLESNGRFTYNYADMNEQNPDSDSGTVGLQVDAEFGLTLMDVQDQARDNYTIWFLPPFWLELDTDNGLVAAGQTGWLRMSARNHVDGLQMDEGVYSAEVIMATNDPDNNSLLIPVNMTLNDLALAGEPRPLTFEMGEAWPNPFNPTTTLRFRLPAEAKVEAALYNMLGQRVQVLINRPMTAGEHRLTVKGSGLSSGVYLLRLQAGEDQAVRKLMLVK